MGRYTVLLASILLAGPAATQAQTRWVVDSKSSLAWWQVSPNLNHLWATTCPGDSSWRPGEGRSSGWYINPALKMPRYGYANVDDTVRVPMFPRTRVYPLCVEAMRGEVTAPDTVHWRGLRAKIDLKSDALLTGEAMRDVLMHQALETSQFVYVTFTLDSLTNITRAGDTVHANAVGTLIVRGSPQPIKAVVTAFHDAGGMRVLTKWSIPARDLKEITPRLHYMGLGVNTNIWHYFFMGADLVLRPEGASTTTGAN